MSHLDHETVSWYQFKASASIDRLIQALRKDQTEEETRTTRARIKAMEEVLTWKPESLIPDIETNFL